MKTTILLNPGSGSAGNRPAIEAALKAAGFAARPRWMHAGKAAKAARAAVEAGAALVIAGGGDGTLNGVAAALSGTGAKLGILPLGTLNHFARDLGIPMDVAEAARLIAAGRARKVDVAEVNGRVFINNSAIGLYPLMVTDREAQEHRLGRRKSWAMAVAAVRTLVRFSRRRLSITLGDRKRTIETPLLFVGNNRYRLEMPGAGTRERLDGGELCVIVLNSRSRLGFFAATLRALFGRARRTGVVRLDGVTALAVDSSRRAITISMDGETALMKTPLRYSIRPKALNVIAP